jgi:formate dehydrogenase subunit gamma
VSDLELAPERRDAASEQHRGMILRYTAGERTNHWLVAMAFVLAALSGLALFHPALFGLSGLFGGGPWTRILHPFIGLLMLLAFLPFALRVGSENRMQPRDWLWLRQYRDVVNNREDHLPEVGRYNAGQKLVFYAIVLCLAGLLLSGLVIWRAYFSLYFPVAVVRLASVVHALCALVLICTIIVHIYAAIWVKGSIEAMTRGRVTPGWAWKHHRAWFREIMTRAANSRPRAD